jgi:hypothetical protein
MDKKWIALTVPNYLKELRKQVEEESKPLNTNKTIEDIKKRKAIAVSVSDAKKFLRNGINLIINKFNGADVVLDENLLKDASQVLSSIEGEEKMLQQLVPDFRSNVQSRWPGPVGYRAVINHLVAVSIRVHSMYPEEDFDSVIRSVSRRIVVPALAHNLTFLRSENRELFDFLLKSDHGLEKLKQLRDVKLDMDDIPARKKISKSDEKDEALKWIRLLNVIRYFMREIKNHDEFISEIQRLTLEHEINPNSSSLWSELSLIASGDLSVDEILVSKVIAELDISPDNNSSKPIISCARARFGLLRYSYGMLDEKDLIMNNPAEALTKTRNYSDKISSMTKIDDRTSAEGFGWAYLWSRYLLIKTGTQSRPKNSDELGGLIEQILSKIYLSAENEDYKKLAIRYLTGFLTNPRFIRPAKFLVNQEKPENYLQQMQKVGLPRGVVSLMRARVSLHKAYAVKDGDPKNFEKLISKTLNHYSDTLNSINATVYSDTMMDGEVSAWAIPEMRMCIELLKNTINETGNKKKSLVSSLTSYQKALDIIGEMQFGVYFDKADEMSRLDFGLNLATRS